MLEPPLFLLVVFFCLYLKKWFNYLYHMKKVCCIISIAGALMACNHSNKEIRERIAGSDSLAINYFKGDGSMDTVVTIRIIRDKQQIDQLAAFIGVRQLEDNQNCGYDGSLHFFKMNQVIQDINFRMNDADCMHFSFLLNNKSQATSLPEGAKELINSFRK